MENENSSLSSILDYSKDYCFEKIQGVISSWNPVELGLSSLEEISASIQKLKGALEAAGTLGSDRFWNVGNTVQEIEYPINELLVYLESPSKSRLNAKDATIFLFFIEEKWRLLRKMAEEQDANRTKPRRA
jgi:hypothetical protein